MALKWNRLLISVTFLCGCALASCQTQTPSPAEQSQNTYGQQPSAGTPVVFSMASPDFKSGEPIPSRFTRDGENISPTLEWAGVPAGTQSLALICDDPDAPMGTWVHWVIVNIPPDITRLPAGGPLPAGAEELINSFGKTTYGGPSPPSGTHRYYFRLYALDVPRAEGIKRAEDVEKMGSHILGRAEVMGTYTRR